MSDTLLRHHIAMLHLNPNAPFPSEVRDVHEMVRRWRYEQRLKLVRPERSDAGRHPDGDGLTTLVGAQET